MPKGCVAPPGLFPLGVVPDPRITTLGYVVSLLQNLSRAASAFFTAFRAGVLVA